MSWRSLIVVPIVAVIGVAFLAWSPTTRGAVTCANVTLTSSSDRRMVTVKPCERVTISLTDCFDCGYRWTVTQKPNPMVLERLSSRGVAPKLPKGSVGGEGAFVTVYRAVGRGRTELTLGYFPPGRGTRPQQRFTLTVSVSGSVVGAGAGRLPRLVISTWSGVKPAQVDFSADGGNIVTHLRWRVAGRTVTRGLLARASSVSATTIHGGSAAQRGLLREVLGTLGRTSISEVRIVRVRGGVNLQSPVQAEQPTWELLVAGIAFHDLSAEQHLPSVRAVEAGQVGWPTSNAAGTKPPRATPTSVSATRAMMRRLARASGARITELNVSAPDALAVALRLRVRDAAAFLESKLATLVERAQAHENRYEGLLIEVDDAHGLAWADGETRLGGDSYVRPSLSGCNPFPPPGIPFATPRCPAQAARSEASGTVAASTATTARRCTPPKSVSVVAHDRQLVIYQRPAGSGGDFHVDVLCIEQSGKRVMLNPASGGFQNAALGGVAAVSQRGEDHRSGEHADPAVAAVAR